MRTVKSLVDAILAGTLWLLGCVAAASAAEPIAHWTFDEGTGTIAYDSVGDNDGVVYGAQWTAGIIGGALDFDGLDDYVALPDNDPVWLPQYNFTLSVWVYFDRDAATSSDFILDLNFADSSIPSNELGCKIHRHPDIGGRTSFNMTTATNTDENLDGNQVLEKGRWYHLVAVRDGTTQAVYINGDLDASRICSPEPIRYTGDLDDNKVNVGKYSVKGVSSAFELQGRVDDVRIYDVALSAQEIQALYSQAPSGPIAHWKFDEGGGAIAYDSAGDNDGVVYGAQWTAGIIGGALDFDGLDDYVALPDNDPVWLPQYNFTLSVWVYFDRDAATSSDFILDLNFGDSSISSNELGCKLQRYSERGGRTSFNMTTAANPDEDLVGNQILEKGRWYHVVAVRNGTTQAVYVDGNLDASRTCSPGPVTYSGDFDDNKVNIGKYSVKGMPSGLELQGMVDDVRIYDVALSAQEIQALYSQAPSGPIAHWKFDEDGGAIAYDSAGDNDGVVYGAQWTAGVIGGALDFDGLDDYVALPDNDPVWLPQENFTLSVWAYFDRPPGVSPDMILDLNLGESSIPTNELGVGLIRHSDVASRLVFNMTTEANTDEDLIGNEVISDGKWYNIIAVRDGTNQALYIDGRLDSTRACSPDPVRYVGDFDDDKVNIGRFSRTGFHWPFYLDGKIDEVRIYDRALSEVEIRELAGAVPGGNTYHVDVLGGSDLNEGLSRANAFKTIAKAIVSAGDGDEILVWPGVYTEPVNFSDKAITLRSAADAAIIEAPGQDAVTFHAGHGSDTVLKNFVIRNSATGISINFANPTLTNLTIVQNDFGIVAYDSDPQISNCILWDNRDGDLFGCTATHSWIQEQLEPDLSDPNSGLAAHWKLDEGTGLIAYDSAGDNDGVIFGAQWVTGQLGGALSFDGVDDHILGSTSPFDFEDSVFSVCAWFRTSASSFEILSEGGYADGWSVGDAGGTNPGAIKVTLKRGGSTADAYSAVTANIYNDDTWHHLAAVVTTSTSDPLQNAATIYVDGSPVSITEQKFTAYTASDAVWLVGAPRSQPDYFSGVLDDIRVYSRALSAAEVSQLYGPVASIEPLFANPGSADYHLRSQRGRYWPEHDIWVLDRVTSPCIDRGDPAADPAAEPMPNGGRINIGAHGGTTYASMSEWPIKGDVNRDGKVDFIDIAMVCDDWLAQLGWYGEPSVP